MQFDFVFAVQKHALLTNRDKGSLKYFFYKHLIEFKSRPFTIILEQSLFEDMDKHKPWHSSIVVDFFTLDVLSIEVIIVVFLVTVNRRVKASILLDRQNLDEQWH